jgi:hypothetical protein
MYPNIISVRSIPNTIQESRRVTELSEYPCLVRVDDASERSEPRFERDPTGSCVDVSGSTGSM